MGYVPRGVHESFVHDLKGGSPLSADKIRLITPGGSIVSITTFDRKEVGSSYDLKLEGRLFTMPLNEWSDVIERPRHYPRSVCMTRRQEQRRKPIEDVDDDIRQACTNSRTGIAGNDSRKNFLPLRKSRPSARYRNSFRMNQNEFLIRPKARLHAMIQFQYAVAFPGRNGLIGL